MAAIRGKDTRPELILRQALHARGFRYRLHNRKLPGRPDLALAKYKAVIFVNGCFWHGHGCPAFKWPKTRQAFWRDKIGGNRDRDTANQAKLQDAGWRCAVVWECALRGKGRRDLSDVADALADWLNSSSPTLEITGTP